jgi:hypothetical protein
MKQAQSVTTRYPSTGRWWARELASPHLGRSSAAPFDPEFCGPPPQRSWLPGRAIVALLGTIWFLIALPFRLVFWTIAWLGRVTGVVLGFVLMVVGMALLAGPIFIVGIPLFIIGLVLTLRCLD